MKPIILACSSLTEYIEEAKAKTGKDIPVKYVNRLYHRDPNEMRTHLKESLEEIGSEYDTVLVAMGFCGGSWDSLGGDKTIVIPKVDDCVSLLLQMGNEVKFNLKEEGHLYVRARNPKTESFKGIFERLTKDTDKKTVAKYYEDWKAIYSNLDIMDTGINGCREEAYYNTVKEDADWLDAEVSYVESGTHLLEKLVTGQWDEQFLVLKPFEKASEEKMRKTR